MSEDLITDAHNHNVIVNTREIYLNSFISANEDDPGVDFRMASTFIKNINMLDTINDKPILIHMYSIGGEWSPGMAMFDAITSCRSFVTILAYGQAASMSSIILQAADLRVMTPYSYFMSHYGSSGFDGHYLNTQMAAKIEKQFCDQMIDIYSSGLIKSKFFKEHYKDGTIEKARNFFMRKLKNGDWYMTPEEAIYYGLSDAVLGDSKAKNIASLRNG